MPRPVDWYTVSQSQRPGPDNPHITHPTCKGCGSSSPINTSCNQPPCRGNTATAIVLELMRVYADASRNSGAVACCNASHAVLCVEVSQRGYCHYCCVRDPPKDSQVGAYRALYASLKTITTEAVLEDAFRSSPRTRHELQLLRYYAAALIVRIQA